MGIPSEPERVVALRRAAEEEILKRRGKGQGEWFQEPAGGSEGYDGRVDAAGVSQATALLDGTGSAFGVRVNGENNMGVEGRYGRSTPTRTFVTVGIAAVQLVEATDKRLQVTVQNLDDANTLFISLGGTPVANQDLMLPPGAMYSLPPGVAYAGAISGVASAADTGVVVVEYTVQ